MHEKLFEIFLRNKKIIKESIEKIKDNIPKNLKWNELPKIEIKEKVFAIDGSYNLIKFRSFIFYAVSAVSVSNYEIFPELEIGIFPNFVEIIDILKIKMILKELELAKKFDDVVILDGSLTSFYNFKPSFLDIDEFKEYIDEWKKIRESIDEISKKENLIFSVAKSSNISKLSKIPPSYFYEDFDVGYSEIFEENQFISFYFKLSKNSQVFKCTTFKKNVNKVDKILSILKNIQINGYPYLLKKAHNASKITLKDIKLMAKLAGITEKTVREVLE